jgi:hypothetical protein
MPGRAHCCSEITERWFVVVLDEKIARQCDYLGRTLKSVAARCFCVETLRAGQACLAPLLRPSFRHNFLFFF